MFKFILLFTAVPFIELAVILRMHDTYAQVWGDDRALTISLGVILVTGIVGAWLARKQGFQVLREIQDGLARGEDPRLQLVAGFMVACGGILLLTPGYLTDILGFSLILPWSRQVISKWFLGKIKLVMAQTAASPGSGPFGTRVDVHSSFYQTSFSSQAGSQRQSSTEAEVIDIAAYDHKRPKA